MPHDARGCPDGDRMSGHVVENDRVRADHCSAPDRDPGPDDHILAEPSTVPDLNRRDALDALVETARAVSVKAC